MTALPLLLLLLIFYSPTIAQSVTSREVLNKMFASIDNVKTLRFKLKKQERINGKLKSGEQDVKFSHTPKRMYTYVYAPNKGVEVLYIEGKNNNHAHINPNAFPYINLNLDPYGSIMRKENHHTVNEVGFEYIKDIVYDISQNIGEDFEKVFILDGEVKFNNRDCYKIVIDYFPFKHVKYTVKQGETVTDIAYEKHLSDYMILELNKEISDYSDVTAGQEILIPNAYAKKTILYIDKMNYLPIVQMMYDDKGLYEQYEFYNLVLNGKISEEEFTVNFEGYGF